MSSIPLRIGVLSIQGAFEEHKNALFKCSDYFRNYRIEAKEIRSIDDITEQLNGVILPGGTIL